ncbi:MAG: phosphoribosylanthranilate isomerase [Alphaproteobacteria bacterium]
MTVRVKICGLKDTKNLQVAIDAGADFVGFVDYPKSPRHITQPDIAKLIAVIPANVASVVVTVNPANSWLEQIHFPVSYIQLHGDESPERVREIRNRLVGTKIIKAISVENAEDIASASDYANVADIILFDTKVPNQHGGSGIAFDWSLLKEKHIALPWMLSGGLNVGNIKEAILQTGAAIVDVSSGVETAPGVKDAALIKQFIEAAKNV